MKLLVLTKAYAEGKLKVLLDLSGGHWLSHPTARDNDLLFGFKYNKQVLSLDKRLNYYYALENIIGRDKYKDLKEIREKITKKKKQNNKNNFLRE